jgi:hypothetical protein
MKKLEIELLQAIDNKIPKEEVKEIFEKFIVENLRNGNRGARRDYDVTVRKYLRYYYGDEK